MLPHYLKNFFKKLLTYERSPHKFALACALAVYIALSPFIGLHTFMLIGAGWLLKLRVPLLLAVGYGINNPITVVPIVMGQYVMGHWFLHSFLNVEIGQSNPWWMSFINNFLSTHVGIQKVSFWAFMIGSNLIALLFAAICYPIIKNMVQAVRDKRARCRQTKGTV